MPHKVDLHKFPSIHAVRQQLAALKRIKLESADIDFLKDRLRIAMAGYVVSSPVIQPGQPLYRGVCHTGAQRPSHRKDLGYPPAGICALGRANRAGQAMFYCSAAPQSTFFELRRRPGDHLAVSQWRVTEPLKVNNVGYSDEVFQLLGSNRGGSPAWFESHPLKDHTVNRLMHNFLAREFARDVAPGNEHEYKLSVAIAEQCLQDIRINIGDGSAPRDEPFAGLVYPAVAVRANVDNVVLRPEFVDRALQLRNVEFIRVDSVSDDGTYHFTRLDYANSFAADGSIEWKGRLGEWRIAPGVQVTTKMANGWQIVGDMAGNLIDAG